MAKRGKTWWQNWSLWLPAFVLGAAVALQGLQIFSEQAVSKGPHLAGFIPAALPGWVTREVPIGPTEFLSKEVEKILNFDEVLNREYVRGGRRFNVYVAYWGAGKMPTRLVASHTPDRCWTENGWRCLEMKSKQTQLFDGPGLKPAEWRLFEPPENGAPTYVLYWHLVEGRIYDYGARFNSIPDPWLWWKDAVQQALHGSREQYFIRLTSNEPLEQLKDDPGFADVVGGLGRLGLFVKPNAIAKR